MSASETRKGPGWWMALDGGWNPPELWPESTPPLPGWVRGADGRWSAPAEPAPVADVQQLDLTIGHEVNAKAKKPPRKSRAAKKAARQAEPIIDLRGPDAQPAATQPAATQNTAARDAAAQPAAPQHAASQDSAATEPSIGQHDPARDYRQPLRPESEARPSLGYVSAEIAPEALVQEASSSNQRRIMLYALGALILGAIAGLVVVLLLL